MPRSKAERSPPQDRSSIYGGFHLYVFQRMSRTVETPAADVLMDRIYGRQRHIYDLTRRYFLLGRDTLIAELRPPRAAVSSRSAAGQGATSSPPPALIRTRRFIGLDVSSAMLSTARANIRDAGFESRITLALGDAARFDSSALFRGASFDSAFFSYSLSMIPPWREALAQALDVVEPTGGRLLVVDFGGSSVFPPWFRRMLLAWLARFHVSPRAELGAALAALAEAKCAAISLCASSSATMPAC